LRRNYLFIFVELEKYLKKLNLRQVKNYKKFILAIFIAIEIEFLSKNRHIPDFNHKKQLLNSSK